MISRLFSPGVARAAAILAAAALTACVLATNPAEHADWPDSDLLGSANEEKASAQPGTAKAAGSAPGSEHNAPPSEPKPVTAPDAAPHAERQSGNPDQSPSLAPKPSDDAIEVLGGMVRTNGLTDLRRAEKANFYQLMLESARRQRELSDLPRAERTLIQMLEGRAPDEIKRPALLELALVMQEQKAYAKAQRLYSEYVRRFPKDGAVPDVLLRQAYLYRDMGVPDLAMSKFFAVMSACLNLQVEEIEYYQKLVLRAQVEIAETFYSLGKYEEASEYLNKVLKLDNSELNRANALFKLVRCYWNLKNFHGAIANARLYLAKYPDTIETPETRYLLSDSLKKLGQDKEAVQEILVLLQKQQARSRTDPQQWLYWQQRAGNDIANQFYQQGDFLKALQVYQSLAALSDSAAWQLPVWYQIGLVFENLKQSPKAAEMYTKILDRHKEASPGAASNEPNQTLQTIVEMARWRKEFLDWENKAQAANKLLEPALKEVESAEASAPGT